MLPSKLIEVIRAQWYFVIVNGNVLSGASSSKTPKLYTEGAANSTATVWRKKSKANCVEIRSVFITPYYGED